MTTFSSELNQKINELKKLRAPTKIGSIDFDSKLILAPMAGICNIPYRLLMEDLGAGGTVSELISCHGINFKNDRTLNMLKIHPKEKNVGIQLFGEDAEAMAIAAKVTEEFKPKFIDINMGCPVRKVVTKGGGSALLKDAKALGPYLEKIKKNMNVPLTIKIRTGWDSDQINADEVINIAYNSGVDFVAIHGRTRAQQYTGKANWDYIESLNENSPLPLIGNGDLHHPIAVKTRLDNTNCAGLMIARGALRNPFIFLESFDEEFLKTKKSRFTGKDHFEVISLLKDYILETYDESRIALVQLRKLAVWFAAGFPGAAKYRGVVFKAPDLNDTMKITEDFFLSLEGKYKFIDYNEAFMTSGHG